jgi:hypothetical protein
LSPLTLPDVGRASLLLTTLETSNWLILAGYNQLGRGVGGGPVPGEVSSENLTQLLMDWSNGDTLALEKLVPLVYRDLHRFAERYLRS